MAALLTLFGFGAGLLAASIEVSAMLALFAQPRRLTPVGAIVGHLLAAGLCLLAARLRLLATGATTPAEDGRRRVECDVVAVTALFVPLFGPALAWLFPRTAPCRAIDAHAWFAQHERMRGQARLHSSPAADDDRLPHDVMSFGEVLRCGSLDHRRNAIRSLAQRGTPRHLGLLRSMLGSDNVELRLSAYGEIQTLARGYEQRLAALQRDLDRLRAGDGERVALLTAAADAHQGYAASGLLDPEMRRYHLQQGVRCGEEAWRADPSRWQVATVYARILSELGDHDHALRALAHLDDAEQQRPEVCVAQAEIAFRKRDFAAVFAAGERMRRQRLAAPDWLQALVRRGAASAEAPS